LHVVHAVAWTEVDLHLDDAGTYTSRIAWITILKPIDPCIDLGARLSISQIQELIVEDLCAPNLHERE
jgi:hypothetical protein